jgi:hydroxymethylbilane synthase
VTPLRLGTRGSRLAHAQAALAAEALRDAGLGPVAIVPISTAGDRDRRSAFSDLGGRGVFSKELEDALGAGRIDVAIHSAKDLTTDETPGLVLAAVLPRADPRDAWCGPHASFAAVPQGARVGTASMRRGAQLRSLRPDLVVESLRGNVDTRLRKRSERGLDGVVLAACGLDRLDLASEIGFRVEVDEMLPETGQGFLALQVRAEDAAAIAAVGEAEGARVLLAERACAALLGGGCRAPVATHAVSQGAGRIWLRAWLALPDGSLVVEADASGDDPAALADEVAAAALARGGEAVVAAVRG